MPTSADSAPTARPSAGVPMSDIYQAARNRAIEEHELDKLFNADFYGDSI